MNTLTLSRIQFALTSAFHFLYVPLTIGLAVLIAIMEYRYWRTQNPVWDEMARFWTKLLAINFAIGVASGITLEFQFGTNWANYSRFVGDIFGAPLAAEGVFAFFLESTFIGLLLFGRDRVSPFMRFFAALMVALGTNLSAFWILAANSWQQTPAGYQIEGGRAVLTSFVEAVFNPSTVPRFLHTIAASYITAAFFVTGISAYYLLKKRNEDMAVPSLKLAFIFGLIFTLLQILWGHNHARQVAHTQPVKLAAFEAQWETKEAAPLLLFALPDPASERNTLEVGLPGMLSLLVHGDTQGTIQGLKDFPPELRPPLIPVFFAYRLMVLLGLYLAGVMLWGAYLWLRGQFTTRSSFLKVLLYSIPIPYVASQLGWLATEVGRQPWIVYGLLKTSEAVSPLPAGQVLTTLVAFTVFYIILFGIFLFLMFREVKGYGMGPGVKEQLKVGGITGVHGSYGVR
ncbi:cytochrome bd-I ubiquinol oxidase subunit 1 apoprotein [Thermanaeromonas toyohensis ToBE]|uniref:Cytochrome bd-I ubiquinol oxidase subunit 1 apoprotein n=1 Tax=Thermanaeromonas toyohensis ToBE TaxID=698762 RepID=A0A1W1VGX6_9FIRM|nr:cytochrome ubiquinol oxidase subunit I [Thermanaeromonas toyohensis]SMB92493.1 cytochrome bd-I ubiquinol oxidase subunit 1 apoprotein [Thermanaeromonas toyohensis ToBE]